MVAVPLWLKSDRTRRIVALVCFFLVEIIVLINLILSSDHPTSALCWSQLSSGDVNLYLGLTKIRGCIDGYGCQSASLRSGIAALQHATAPTSSSTLLVCDSS